MPVIRWAIPELASYGIVAWVLFGIIAIGAAFLGRLPGIFIGHIIVTALVALLDMRWVNSEMLKPGWDGSPDQDFVFMIAVLVRIVLINTLLLPASFAGLALARWAGRRRGIFEMKR